MSDDLVGRLYGYAASNMFVEHTHNPRELCREAADALEAKDARIAELERDARRIDLLEACIRDGSYASILNDIVAVCQHSYSTIGPGPALRSAIDAAIAEQEKP